MRTSLYVFYFTYRKYFVLDACGHSSSGGGSGGGAGGAGGGDG